jgi:hypothetical protein
MDTITAPKLYGLNQLEGLALTIILLAFPIFASAALMVKLVTISHIVAPSGNAAHIVPMASVFYALIMRCLGPRFPKQFKNAYEPLFFDATLPFAEKIQRWRMQPTTSLQLMTWMLLLSLLAVGVASLG